MKMGDFITIDLLRNVKKKSLKHSKYIILTNIFYQSI